MTVQYRGVDKGAVIDSLRRGVDFIQACHLGPASEKLVRNVMEACKPFDILPAAADDRALAMAMKVSRASYLVGIFHDVFAHQARTERANGVINGPAQALYRDLCEWDAFYGFKPADEIAGEVADYIIADCLVRVKKSDDAQTRLRLDAIPTEYPETAEWFQRLAPILELIDPDTGQQDILNLMDGGHRYDKNVLKKALYGATGLSDANLMPNVRHAFHRYGIIPPSAQDVPVTMEEKLVEFLEPYTATHEADLRSVRIFSDSISNLGVNFTATPRVAHEVADAFRQYAGYKLIDYDTAIVDPRPVLLSSSLKPPSV